VAASDKEVGAVQFQEIPDEVGVVHEPIGFASQKLSLGCLQEGGLCGILRSESRCLLSAGNAGLLRDRSSESIVDREFRRADCREAESVLTVVCDVQLFGGKEYCRKLSF